MSRKYLFLPRPRDTLVQANTKAPSITTMTSTLVSGVCSGLAAMDSPQRSPSDHLRCQSTYATSPYLKASEAFPVAFYTRIKSILLMKAHKACMIQPIPVSPHCPCLSPSLTCPGHTDLIFSHIPQTLTCLWAFVLPILYAGNTSPPTLLSSFSFLRSQMNCPYLHSSVLAWRVPGMGEPGGLPSVGSHRVGHD